MRLIIDDKIPYIHGQAERLGETLYLPGAAITAADVRHADALIIRTRTLCNRRLLEGSNVQFIATATIGFDHIDTAFLRDAGIGWTNCPGCNASSVAQYVVAALWRLQAEGRITLPGSTVGIVGVGNVGREVSRAVSTLGCRTLHCDPPRAEREGEAGFVALDTIAREADIITLHVPLSTSGTHATHHMADKSFFRSLQRRPIFINAARGEVMHTQAVKDALREGQIRAAVIDTWENEPHIDRELLTMAHIATPHIAGYSADGKANGTRMALQAVARHFALPEIFDVSASTLPPDYPGYFADVMGRMPDIATPGHSPLFHYDPAADSLRLKHSPEAFEHLRGHYPLRREA